MTEQPKAGSPKEWWGSITPNQRRNIVFGGVIVLVLLLIVYTAMSTPSLRQSATTPMVDREAPNPHVFGGGRSNVLALEELDRRLEAEAQANKRMRDEHDERIAELANIQEQFEEWTQTAGIEREAARALRRLEQLQQRATQLEEKIQEGERRTAGVPIFEIDATRNAGPSSPTSEPEMPPQPTDQSPESLEQASGATDGIQRPEPDPSNDEGVMAQDLFSGVGITPRRQQEPLTRRLRETLRSSPEADEEEGRTRSGLIINGRSLAQIQEENSAPDSESPGDTPPVAEESTEQAQRQQKPARSIRTELPAASILSGVLLHGMDAPTGSGARGQPVPLLIRVKELAIIPNHKAMDLEDCHAIGEGFGSMSEERAFGRLIDLVCTRANGEIIHSSLRGYLVGPDGKVGIRGPVVQRNGALIARSIYAGAFSGFGQALGGRRGRGVTISTSGEPITDSLGDIAEESVAGGIGTAMQSIADFYLEQARAIYPVIEVSPETPVDIVLTAPLEIQPMGET